MTEMKLVSVSHGAKLPVVGAHLFTDRPARAKRFLKKLFAALIIGWEPVILQTDYDTGHNFESSRTIRIEIPDVNSPRSSPTITASPRRCSRAGSPGAGRRRSCQQALGPASRRSLGPVDSTRPRRRPVDDYGAWSGIFRIAEQRASAAMTDGQPKQPVTVSREDLYAQVWATPLMQLAERYGIRQRPREICRPLASARPPVAAIGRERRPARR